MGKQMIEVFKTNVKKHYQAAFLITQIHQRFADHTAHFDLDDCDRILRVQCQGGPVQTARLIAFLSDFGFHAEVLPDDHPPASLTWLLNRPARIWLHQPLCRRTQA